MKKKRLGILIGIIVCALLFVVIVPTVTNHMGNTYESLNDMDQKILSELDTYIKSENQQSTWLGFNLKDQTNVAMNGTFGKAYLVNPTNKPNGIFAQEITMPQDSSLHVYRLSVVDPEAFVVRFDMGTFNTSGKTYSVNNDDVFYTKYDTDQSIDAQYSQRHFITYLTHEAFHYYMQTNWNYNGPDSANLLDSDIDLIAKEYDVLAKVQTELQTSSPDHDTLKQCAKDYVSIMEERIENNPSYVEDELSKETAEGTATYVAISASKEVGYDYGVMYFDNIKNVSFSDVIPTLKEGKIEKEFLASRMPYETGAILCQLIDQLKIEGWQEKLNSQTNENYVYLYDILKDYVNELN